MSSPIQRGRILRAAALAALATSAFAPAASGSQASDPAYLKELGSELLPLSSGAAGAIADARDVDLAVSSKRVLVDVYVSGDAESAAQRLASLGMTVGATGSSPLPVVEGWLPTDELAPAAQLGLTDAILAVQGTGVDVGAKTSEGVAAHNIPAAIAAAGTTGTGVDVGVISDSIDQLGGGIDASQASGDLPPDPQVQVLLDDPGASDEGRAMSEIIFDEAPGLNRLIFSSGTALGAAGKAASIDNLVTAGADVIADDIFLLTEPMFQDGQVAQAVDRAKAAGVPYFASAGNRARQSYEGTYSDSGGLHDFDTTGATNTRNCFSGSVPNLGFIQFALQWDEPWGGATTDLNLRITNPGGATLASGTTANITTGIPMEFVTFSNGGAAVQPCVEISRVAGSRAPFMKWIERDNYTQGTPLIDTQSNTINPDAASAAGSMSVAAVSASDVGLNTPEAFSSRGPNTRLFDSAGNRLAAPLVRINPDLAAADDVSNTVPGFQPTFTGTSAATPSAAGIAAILRSENPGATVNEIYSQMSDPLNAIDCTSSAVVPDPDCGAGFILADRAVAGLDRTGPVVTAAPAGKAGKKGWFVGDVTVNWTPADPDSPLESSNCPAVTVTTDGTQTLTCNVVSGGGPTTGSVTIQRDIKPPSKPKVKGIKNGKAYSASQLPKKVKCKAKDKTSGIDKCKVKGYKTNPGKHKLKAVATDVAGNKSKSKVAYEVK